MVRARQPGGSPSPTGLADVIETILDKGLVIDSYVQASLAGVEGLTVDARIAVASLNTYAYLCLAGCRTSRVRNLSIARRQRAGRRQALTAARVPSEPARQRLGPRSVQTPVS